MFAEACNVGINLGAMSPGIGPPDGRGLVDVDLDCPEAVPFADAYLPPTDAVFGRKGKPGSHRLYWALPLPQKTSRHKDVDASGKRDGPSLAELRSTGGQSVAPPSTHPSGERVAWERRGEPATADGRVLALLVAKVAAGAILSRHWPGKGGRHDASLAVAGMLLRGGWEVDDAADFIDLIAETAGDEEHADRRKDVATTRARLIAGEAIVGQPSLAGIMGDAVVTKAAAWLALRGSTQRAVPAGVDPFTGELHDDLPDQAAPAATPKERPCTDLGNAERLADQHGADLRFTQEADWLAWSGCHWDRDATGEVTRRACAIVRSIPREAASLDDLEKRNERLRHAIRSESRTRIEAMVSLARSLPGIAARFADFDTNLWLLNCQNGTLDLHSGAL